ncbi:MAG: AAA family ATPase [Holophagales bacterium]|nr:AAA family ATPase [Holophagales bacterium]
MTASPPRTFFLRALGLAGWDALDPVVLAAVASEAPLLLIGPHGSAKTMVLNRLAEALGLEHRHYNASLLSFDDLVGFPVPQEGRVVYLQTPATVWDAESVLIDEVSRCRPEVQNKLFPLVHERVLQGMPLPKLRHRWGAMNPPASLEGDDTGYAGAEPLDVALADRFAFVVTVPALAELAVEEQRRVLRPSRWSGEEARPEVVRLVEEARAGLDDAGQSDAAAATEYAILLAAQLARAGHPLSTRRAAQLVRNVIAVRAAAQALGDGDDPEAAFLVAARSSVPDAAWGRPVPFEKLLAAHRSAWAAAGMAEGSARRRLLTEREPFVRLAIALEGTLPPHEAAEVLSDAYSALALPERLIAAALVMPRLTKRRDLPAAALEPICNDWAEVGKPGAASVTSGPGTRWVRPLLTTELPKLDRKTEKGRVLSAVAAHLLFQKHEFRLEELLAAWERAVAALRPAGRKVAA